MLYKKDSWWGAQGYNKKKIETTFSLYSIRREQQYNLLILVPKMFSKPEIIIRFHLLAEKRISFIFPSRIW